MSVVVLPEEEFDNIREQLSTLTEAVTYLTSHQAAYLSSRQVMEMTGFKNNWIQNHKNEIGHTLVDGQLRFRRQDVIAYMDQNYTKLSTTNQRTRLTA
jgi:hypothetical protein